MNTFVRQHHEQDRHGPPARPFPTLNLNPNPSLASAQPDTETWRLRLGLRLGLRTGTRRREGGHTLTELMVSMTIVLLVLAGVLASHVFGLRLFEMNKAKLGASDDARAALGHMVSEIRAAKLVRIGTGSAAGFTEVAPNTPQRGSAIQVYPTTSTNTFVRYFRDTDQKLKRLASGGAATIVASSLSNQVLFTSEDFRGTVLTNNENNRVIGLTLQFYQLEYPAVTFGPGNLYDYYQLRTKITRRALE